MSAYPIIQHERLESIKYNRFGKYENNLLIVYIKLHNMFSKEILRSIKQTLTSHFYSNGSN